MNVVSETVRVHTNLRSNSVLHLWIRARQLDRAAAVSIQFDTGAKAIATSEETVEFDFVELRPGHEGWADLTWRDGETAVSYIYAFDPNAVLDTGISILFIADDTRSPSPAENYHFRPPLGWMNDPNGFCRVGETYHLFYQHYPHAQVWSAMHWGHATSTDLVNWVHQPIALRPDPAIAREHKGAGGVLSGSAVPLGPEGGLRLFFTESFPGRVPSVEMQRTAVVSDGIEAGPSHVIVDRSPDGLGLGSDFRDPFVFKGPDGRYRMVVGSSDQHGGVTLMFHTDDPEGAAGWSFHSVLHQDRRSGTRCVECACLVPLNGTPRDAGHWALIYGQLKRTDYSAGPRHPTLAIVGTFDGDRFTPIFEQSLDFAAGSYGFQAFPDYNGPIAIGWLADWSDWDTKSSFPTSMTLPRRLRLSQDGSSLLTPPVESALSLRYRDMDVDALLVGRRVPLVGGAVEIRIVLAEARVAFRLEIGHPVSPLAIVGSLDGLEMLTGPGVQPSKRYLAQGASPTELRIFLDTGSIEVFADEGRWTATKRVGGTEPFADVRLVADPTVVREVRAWKLALPSALSLATSA
jgi:beta-fructofuranosidase